MGLVEFAKSKWAPVLAALAFVFSACIVITTSGQPLVEINAFRQTQTALTSFWMVKEGWQLAYQTPVGGSPWSIPFEFPIYQAIVAVLVKLGGLPIDPVGRLVSFAFLIGCAWPALRAARSLHVSREAAWVFCALLWTSPFYIVWSRTFSIETTALFFTLAAIPFGLEMRKSEPPIGAALLVATFGTLAALQKITSAAPALAVVGVLVAADYFRRVRTFRISARRASCWAIAFGVPAIASVAWIVFTDVVKTQNLLGTALTSKALMTWNFGELDQRFDLSALRIVFWDRLVASNISSIAGLVIVASALAFAPRTVRAIVTALLVLFVVPVLIFTNLHVNHEYYQVATTAFLIAALAVATVHVGGQFAAIVSPAVAVLLCMCNVVQFKMTFWPFVSQSAEAFSHNPNTHLDVADVLRRYTPAGSAIVVFGADWDSTIPYYAQRKAFMVPAWPDRPEWAATYDRVWRDPSAFVGGLQLGALVYCDGRPRFNLEDIMERPEVRRGDPLYKIGACRIWLGARTGVVTHDGRVVQPEAFFETLSTVPPAGLSPTATVACEGSIDLVRSLAPDGLSVLGHVLTIAGWVAVDGKAGLAADAIYVTIRDERGEFQFVATRPTPRPDVAQYFKRSFARDVGFSTSILVEHLHGAYQIGMARSVNGTLEMCDNLRRPILIP